MICGHTEMSAAAVLFWPLLAITLFILFAAIVSERQQRLRLRDARRRLERVERRLSER